MGIWTPIATTDGPATTLAADITDVATTLTATDASKLPPAGSHVYAQIGTEWIKITGAAANPFTIQRAMFSSTAAAHSSGAGINLLVVPQTIEDMIDEQAPAASPVQSVAGKTGAVTLTKSDVGLSNADNTADTAKPVSVAQQAALDRKIARTSTILGLGSTFPTPASSPATVGEVTSSTSLASGETYDCQSERHFTILGGNPARSASNPYPYRVSSMYSAGSGAPPWAVEFHVVTAGTALELIINLTGGSWRIVVDDEIGETYTDGIGSGPLGYLPITLASAGAHKIRIEMSANAAWQGVRLAAKTDTLAAAAGSRTRCMVLGDSFTAPTISDSGASHSWDGWVQRLGYITGWDCWSAASGGTGILNPGPGVKFRDRVADITAYAPDIVLIAGGLDDSQTGTTYAALRAEYELLIDALASVPVVVAISPFWPRGIRRSNAGILKVAQAVKDAAAAKAIPHLDLLTPTDDAGLSSTTSRVMTAGGNRLYTVAEVRSRVAKVIIGDAALGHSVEMLDLPNGADTSGGDYNYYIPGSGADDPTFYAHAIGEPVRSVSGAYISGTGRQGATADDGNADVVTGTDGTHPTAFGHGYIARCVAAALTKALG